MEVSNYVTVEKKDGIATFWLDQKDESINKVSPEMVGLFHGLMDDIENDPEIKAGIIISKKKDFIAGADIEAFQKVKQPGDFAPISRKGHEILNRIENSKKPMIAAIHGTCYGAGLEISLACHARICSDHKTTKLALPEVKLGLLPGGGGTQRLPRLIGLQKALDMMLTGKNIFAKPAKRMGLVDEITNKNKLYPVAIKLAQKLIDQPIKRKRKQKLLDQFLNDTAIGRKIVFKQARKMVYGFAKGNYPAPLEIINCAEIGLSKGMKAGLEAEAERFEKLILTPESKQLIGLFFGMTEKKKNPFPEKVKELKTLGMLGAGFMGAGITEVSVNNGINVLLKDIKDETIASAKEQIWKGLSKKIKRGGLSKIEAEKTIAKIRGQLDYQDFENVDVVIEAVLERLDLKKQILAEIEEKCAEDTIFASNTSSLLLSKIAEGAKRPQNIIGMHYFSPVTKMPLLEIVKTPQTADWVIASCYDMGVKQGKTCVVVNDCPGFYVNRILGPYLNETGILIEEGAKIDAIDKAIKKKGMPVGPMALIDEVGVDILAHAMTDEMLEYARSREGAQISMTVKKMYEAGMLGKKNKKGFYLYNEKNKKDGENSEVYKLAGGAARKEFKADDIVNRPLLLLIKEAIVCLEEGIISSPSDGDIGAVFGIGFLPFTGGPFQYVDAIGADNMVKSMESYMSVSPRFRPPQSLYDMAKNGKKFHNE